MKKAVQLPQYSDTHEFHGPEGVQIVSIDKVSNLLSDAACPDSYDAAFLDGTAPTDTCDHPPTIAIFCKRSSASASRDVIRAFAQPSTSVPSGIGWQRAHQNVTRASGPWMRLRIASPQRRQGSPAGHKPTGSRRDRTHAWCAAAVRHRSRSVSPESSSTLAATSLCAAAIKGRQLLGSSDATLQKGLTPVTKHISDLKTLPTPAITS